MTRMPDNSKIELLQRVEQLQSLLELSRKECKEWKEMAKCLVDDVYDLEWYNKMIDKFGGEKYDHPNQPGYDGLELCEK